MSPRRPRHLSAAWVVVLAAALASTTLTIGAGSGAGGIQASSVSLSRSWRRVTTEAFTVVVEGSDADARDTARRLMEFRDAVRRVFPAAKLDPLVPTTLVVFASNGSFTPFKPRNNGRRVDWVGGYAMMGADVNYLVMGRYGDPSDNFGIVFHEYAHYILHRTFPTLPFWYDEGVADFFSGFAGTTSDSRRFIGRPLPHRLEVARGQGLLPVRDMLVDVTAAKWQREMTSRYYATAWLMAHYFLMEPGRREGLLTLLDQLQRGVGVDDAVRAAFAMSVADLDVELGSYLRRSALPAFAFVTETDAALAQPVERMPQVDVDRLLSDLLVRVGDLRAADAALDEALERTPDDDGLRTVRAQRLLAERKYDDTLAVLRQQRGPRTSEALQLEARALAGLGRLDEATERLTLAAATGAPTPGLLFDTGRTQMARAAWPQATAAFARLNAVDPRPMWDLRRAYEAYRLGFGVYAAGAARAYVRKAGWSAPSSPYAAFAGVLGLLRDKRAGEATTLLTELAAATQGEVWPAPIVAFLQNRTSARDLLAIAKSERERTEAHAYIGLLASAEGRRELALEHLSWVKANGEEGLVEFSWALAELDRLNVPPQ